MTKQESVRSETKIQLLIWVSSHTVQRFCKEVAMWKNLSHPNVLNLIGITDTLEDGRFSMVSEWMANGNIMEHVRAHAGNHLKLVGRNRVILRRYLLSTFQLTGAIEGLRYLHNANIVHGDLKGVSFPTQTLQTPLM
jgi:serine/threonine protein kinase